MFSDKHANFVLKSSKVPKLISVILITKLLFNSPNLIFYNNYNTFHPNNCQFDELKLKAIYFQYNVTVFNRLDVFQICRRKIEGAHLAIERINQEVFVAINRVSIQAPKKLFIQERIMGNPVYSRLFRFPKCYYLMRRLEELQCVLFL